MANKRPLKSNYREVPWAELQNRYDSLKKEENIGQGSDFYYLMKQKRPLRFEYWKTDDGQFHWHVKASNGEIIALGESYKRKAGVLNLFKALFDSTTPPTIAYLNEGEKRKPRFVKPKNYEGRLNRNWP